LSPYRKLTHYQRKRVEEIEDVKEVEEIEEIEEIEEQRRGCVLECEVSGRKKQELSPLAAKAANYPRSRGR
jgi:hypothetical protein